LLKGGASMPEQLGKDMGFYRILNSDLGRLTRRVVVRACPVGGRTAVLHYERWSREQAIQYLDENSAAGPTETIVA